MLNITGVNWLAVLGAAVASFALGGVVLMTKQGAERNRFSSRQKTEAVMRLLRGEDIDSLSRELNVTAQMLSGWRDDFLASGQANLESRPRVEVRVLGPADAPDAVAILARAFDQEPTKLALIPDSRIRRTVIEMSVNARLYDALRYGAVHGAQIDDELGAVALWYPPGVSKLSITGAARAALAWLSNIPSVARAFPRIARMLLSDVPGAVALFSQRRPAVDRATRGMTWRLDLLGTVSEHRGKGLARALLERQLHRCDQDGAAVWLDATDPVNPPIYERFGFETIAHIDGPTWLPGYWVMRREPRTV